MTKLLLELSLEKNSWTGGQKLKKIKKTILLFFFLFLLPSYSMPVSVNKRSIFSDARNKINYYRVLNNRPVWNKCVPFNIWQELLTYRLKKLIILTPKIFWAYCPYFNQNFLIFWEVISLCTYYRKYVKFMLPGKMSAN